MSRLDWPVKDRLSHTLSTGLRTSGMKIQGGGLMCSMNDLTKYVL